MQALLNYKFEAACVASGNDEIPVGALVEVLAGHWGEAKSKQDLIELQAAAVADALTGNGPQMIKRPAETLFPGDLVLVLVACNLVLNALISFNQPLCRVTNGADGCVCLYSQRQR